MKNYNKLLNLLEDKFEGRGNEYKFMLQFYFDNYRTDEGVEEKILRLRGYSVVLGKGETEYDAVLDAMETFNKNPAIAGSIFHDFLDLLGEKVEV